MAIYSAGRRRTMLILLLTSVLLITLDLRGNAVFNAARSGFGYALRPLEIAGDVITSPIARLWSGVTEVDDLKDENRRLQDLVDAQRSVEIAGQNALIENRRLRSLLDLESLAEYDRVTAGIIGSSPSNFDQRVEIDRGSRDGIRVGMPVVNNAGLVGKITFAAPEVSTVMLVTDPQYSVPVKVVAEVPATPPTVPPSTVPSGLAVEDVTTTTSTTTTTTTTLPPEQTADFAVGDGSPDLSPLPATTTTSSTTTTTTLPPIEERRETGLLNGVGADRFPRVSFVADSPQFGRIAEGDAVLTAGGSLSLAPPNIPIGRIANVIPRAGTAGLELETELNADLERLNFLSVILYQPPTGAGR
ncbi:MAG: rod shape-determining protein MreC [Ilumatobacter sp.]|uniref:rod shape-determining protein MreC n=1 Tax=Ilumatobacter sp. TaxID=1967498 RepID=UPI002621A9A5|nr:rod shape-determining protein MreC [Ilumatobacter sp.]MDJ0771271.1 rod shape-determining protein MreC [Ilumatobacter sp.]